MTSSLDPITAELVASALVYASEEMGIAVRDAAYSPNIKERLDHSCALFDALAREGDVALGEQGVAKADRSFVRELDLRYVGQSTELVVTEPRSLEQAVDAFHARHEARYGFAARRDPVEIVTARVVAIGTTPKPRLVETAAPARRAPEARALRERRDVFDGTTFADTPVFNRALLRPGDAFDGPAVVEQYDATTYIAPAWSARVDGFGNLVLEHAR